MRKIQPRAISFCLFAAVLLTVFAVSCQPEPDRFKSFEAAPSHPTEIQEAYISVQAASAHSENTVSAALAYAQNQKAEATATPQKKVELVPVTFGNTTYYRLNGSNYMIRKPVIEDQSIKSMIKARADQMLQIQAAHPDIPIYIYMVVRATDMDWYADAQGGIKAYNYAPYFQSLIAGNPKIKFDYFKMPDLQYYEDTGYKTDFHVNYKGSYQVYQDIYQMMAGDLGLSPMLVPEKTLDFDNLLFCGALLSADDVKPYVQNLPEDAEDVFKAYAFNYGSYTEYLENKRMILGLEDEYAAGQINRDLFFNHQFSYYGGQAGLIQIKFDHPDKPNLLMLSDSQGRPSRRQIAYHFNNTVFLDDVETRSMDLEQVIQDYDIGVILLVGQVSMFEVYETN